MYVNNLTKSYWNIEQQIGRLAFAT